MVKTLPIMWETQVQSLGQEDPLEKGMATHSSIIVWRIPWILHTTERLSFYFLIFLLYFSTGTYCAFSK